MDIDIKLAVSSEPLEYFDDSRQSLTEIKNTGTKSSYEEFEFSSTILSDFKSTSMSDFNSEYLSDFSSREVSDFSSDEQSDGSFCGLSDFSSHEFVEFNSRQHAKSKSRKLADSSSQELKDYAYKKLIEHSSQNVAESDILVTEISSCPYHNEEAFIEMRDPDVIRYRWALEEQKDWFRFNLDPFYHFYQVLEPPLPRAPVDLLATESLEAAETNGNQFEENEEKVPEGIRSILKMLRDFDEEESRNF